MHILERQLRAFLFLLKLEFSAWLLGLWQFWL